MMERDIRGEIQTAVVLVLLIAAVGLSGLILTSINTEEQPTGTPVEIVSNVQEVSASETAPPPSKAPSNTPTTTETRTSSPAPTETRTPSPAPTETRTPSPAPTETRTPSPAPTETRTPSPAPTETRTPSPASTETRTPSPASTETRTPTALPCTQPIGWASYTVARGNTLFSIARAVGSTVSELRTVNCLANADNIQTGDVLFVPQLPNGPVRTGVPVLPESEAAVRALVKVGCGVAASDIVSPGPGERISGLFTLRGTGALEGADFQFYRLEVRPDYTNTYNFYARSETPVFNGVLGEINSDIFDDGLYWVRLTVVDNTGNFIEPCEVPVIFE